jgi:LysR family transcriptional regulator, hydrogen peroxide-inducible genes activator
MTLTEFRYIVALAQEQHFGRAAERCHVSQPTLSIAVKKLEQELGAPLFERSKQRASLTPLGERIVAAARQVLDQTAAIKDLADADKDQLQGPLSLGTEPTIGPYLLPQFIPLLRETAKSLSLYVEEADREALVLRLRDGELDALLVSGPLDEPEVVTQTLFEEPFVLLLPSDHRLTSRHTIEASDLEPAELLLLGEGERFRAQVLEAFPHLEATRAANGGRRPFNRGATLETLRHMVASRLGIAIVPQSAAASSMYAPELLQTRPFAPPVPTRTVALAWRISYPRHKAIEVLRQAVRACSSAYWNYSTVSDRDTPGVLVENSNW